MGAYAFTFRGSLVRSLWCALHPERGFAGMPEGCFHGRRKPVMSIPRQSLVRADVEQVAARLRAFFAGGVEEFIEWIRERTSKQAQPFELCVREADLKTLVELRVKLSIENWRV